MKKVALSIFTFLFCASVGFSQAKNTSTKTKTPVKTNAKKSPKETPNTNLGHHHVEDLPIGANMRASHIKMRVPGKNEMVSLSDVATKEGLIVMFSCNTCPYVVKAQAHTKEIMKYAKEKGIGMIIVNSNEAQRAEDDSPMAMEDYYHRQQYTVPYVMDQGSMLADVFGATHTPEVFLFDGESKLVYKGALEDNPSDPSSSKHFYIKEAVDNMLANTAISPKVTRSIGCGIKRNDM